MKTQKSLKEVQEEKVCQLELKLLLGEEPWVQQEQLQLVLFYFEII